MILRQIVKTTFGDTINRRIVESVAELTSSEQIAEYVKTLKNALWPNGILAEQGAERDAKTKNRTRVAAKVLLLCSVTGEPWDRLGLFFYNKRLNFINIYMRGETPLSNYL